MRQAATSEELDLGLSVSISRGAIYDLLRIVTSPKSHVLKQFVEEAWVLRAGDDPAQNLVAQCPFAVAAAGDPLIWQPLFIRDPAIQALARRWRALGRVDWDARVGGSGTVDLRWQPSLAARSRPVRWDSLRFTPYCSFTPLSLLQMRAHLSSIASAPGISGGSIAQEMAVPVLPIPEQSALGDGNSAEGDVPGQVAAAFRAFYQSSFAKDLELREYHPGLLIFQEAVPAPTWGKSPTKGTWVIVEVATIPGTLQRAGNALAARVLFSSPAAPPGAVRAFVFSPGDACVEVTWSAGRARDWLGSPTARDHLLQASRLAATFRGEDGLATALALVDCPALVQLAAGPDPPYPVLAGAWACDPASLAYSPIIPPDQWARVLALAAHVYSVPQGTRPSPVFTPATPPSQPPALLPPLQGALPSTLDPPTLFQAVLTWKQATGRGVPGPVYFAPDELRALLQLLPITPPGSPASPPPSASSAISLSTLPLEDLTSPVPPDPRYALLPPLQVFVAFQKLVRKRAVQLVSASDRVLEFVILPAPEESPVGSSVSPPSPAPSTPPSGNGNAPPPRALVFVVPPLPTFRAPGPSAAAIPFPNLLRLLQGTARALEVYVIHALDAIVEQSTPAAVFIELIAYRPEVQDLLPPELIPGGQLEEEQPEEEPPEEEKPKEEQPEEEPPEKEKPKEERPEEEGQPEEEKPEEEQPEEEQPEKEKPEKKPEEKPEEQKPEESQQEEKNPEEKPAEGANIKPEEIPNEEKPAEKTEAKPEEKSKEEKPGAEQPEEEKAETKPEEKPKEEKPEEKPKEEQPEEAQTEEKQPEEEQPEEEQPEEGQPGENQPEEMQPEEEQLDENPPPLFFGYDFPAIAGLWHYDAALAHFDPVPVAEPPWADYLALFAHLEQSTFHSAIQLWDDTRRAWVPLPDAVKDLGRQPTPEEVAAGEETAPEEEGEVGGEAAPEEEEGAGEEEASPEEEETPAEEEGAGEEEGSQRESGPRTIAAPKVIEGPKAVAAPKAVEGPKTKEAPEIEAPKAKETPKVVEAPEVKEAPKGVEGPKTFGTPEAGEQPEEEPGEETPEEVPEVDAPEEAPGETPEEAQPEEMPEKSVTYPSVPDFVLARVQRIHPTTKLLMPAEEMYLVNADSEHSSIDLPQDMLEATLNPLSTRRVCFISGASRRILKTTSNFLLFLLTGRQYDSQKRQELSTLLENIKSTSQENRLNFSVSVDLDLKKITTIFSREETGDNSYTNMIQDWMEDWEFGVVWHLSFGNPGYIEAQKESPASINRIQAFPPESRSLVLLAQAKVLSILRLPPMDQDVLLRKFTSFLANNFLDSNEALVETVTPEPIKSGKNPAVISELEAIAYEFKLNGKNQEFVAMIDVRRWAEGRYDRFVFNALSRTQILDPNSSSLYHIFFVNLDPKDPKNLLILEVKREFVWFFYGYFDPEVARI